MNYLELLLHPGSEESSTCEKTADCLLTFPRCLWLSREVRIISQDEIIYKESDCGDLFNCFCKNSIPFTPSPGTAVTFLLNLAFVDLPAAMLACVGMPIKHVELISNEKAYAYSKLVECLLLKNQYETKKKKLLQKMGRYDSYHSMWDYEPVQYSNQKTLQLEIKLAELETKINECDEFLNESDL